MGLNLSKVFPTEISDTVSEVDEESRLVADLKKDPEAFGELYRRYLTPIYRYIYVRLGNKADAEDLTSEVFLRALRKLDTYRYLGYPFSAWLFRIAYHLIIDYRRSRRPTKPVDDFSESLADDREDPLASVLRDEEHGRLKKHIESLPRMQQEALALRFSGGLKNREIGKVLGKSEATVKMMIHRAVSALKGVIEDEESRSR